MALTRLFSRYLDDKDTEFRLETVQERMRIQVLNSPAILKLPPLIEESEKFRYRMVFFSEMNTPTYGLLDEVNTKSILGHFVFFIF